jgi:hypothetical protein
MRVAGGRSAPTQPSFDRPLSIMGFGCSQGCWHARRLTPNGPWRPVRASSQVKANMGQPLEPDSKSRLHVSDGKRRTFRDGLGPAMGGQGRLDCVFFCFASTLRFACPRSPRVASIQSVGGGRPSALGPWFDRDATRLPRRSAFLARTRRARLVGSSPELAFDKSRLRASQVNM